MAMVKNLAKRKDLRVLAIDADPAVGLCTALGIEIKKTVDDIYEQGNPPWEVWKTSEEKNRKLEKK